jgi:phosphoglycerate dehydrogenase-like enzyme
VSPAKPSAFVINVARAEIFEEAALYDALASGRLAGAALDVWFRYPASAAPTWPPRCRSTSSTMW